MFREHPSKSRAVTVPDYIQEKTQGILARMEYHLDPNLGLDQLTTFYLYIPFNPNHVNLNLDCKDFVNIVSSACKERYIRVHSSLDAALRFPRSPQTTIGGRIYSILQLGFHEQRKSHASNSFQIPKLLPNFVIYEISNITTRELINRDLKSLLPAITSFSTDHIDEVSPEARKKLTELAQIHDAAEAAWMTAHYDRDAKVELAQWSAAFRNFENYLVSLGKPMTYREFEEFSRMKSVITKSLPKCEQPIARQNSDEKDQAEENAISSGVFATLGKWALSFFGASNHTNEDRGQTAVHYTPSGPRKGSDY